MTTIADPVMDAARRLMDRCDELAAITEEPGMITRRYGTPLMRDAMTRVRGWMADAGMDVREDAIGNLIGTYAADPASGDPRRFVLGGHLDSVRDAGRYDGILGVLSGIAVVERLHAAGERLPFAVDVAAFIEEEGLRFHSSFIASRAYAGIPLGEQLGYVDEDGVSLADAIRAYGGDPDAIPAAAVNAADLLGFIEAHIEQGPVLEREDLPVGIVSSIVGSTRATVALTGMAGHAGTVPMTMRRDALAAAAEVVLAVEAVGRETPGLVATVGQLHVAPGASNVIPGSVEATLDLRHADAAIRERAYEPIRARGQQIAAARAVQIEWTTVAGYEATPSDPRLMTLLADAIAAEGIRPLELTSGAGHDAISLATIAPVVMLFVRCKDGTSHNPAESIEVADVAVALRVLDGFLRRLAP
jgi:hydantoinase/carbamoylase family amidase